MFSTFDKAEKTESAKHAEREWHDDFYRPLAPLAYPGSQDKFLEWFRRMELTPFYEGGWNWWADLRREAMDLVGNVRGLRVLDYGCGLGRLGIYLALRGADVRGFDLSAEAVGIAESAARRYGLSAHFETMDAERLTYAGDFFDLVVGFGVLHHVVKYPNASSQLYRILKPGGWAVFCETLWDNPVINLLRRFTREAEEAGDAYLTEAKIRSFAQGFSQVEMRKRHLLYMLKRLARRPEANPAVALQPRSFWKMVKHVEDALLHLPLLPRYCGEVIVVLQK
ncbi:MAG: class I SAM-dependent methyltransferase [Candidatus Korobacteraceae bacterium]